MNKHDNHYDLIIVGAGLAGASLAALMAKQQFRVALLETHLPKSLLTPNIIQQDTRPLALNYASKQILHHVGIWSRIENVTPITQVLVSEQGRFGKLRFHAKDYELPALGYVVPFTQLHQLLYDDCTHANEVTVIPISQLTAIHCCDEGADVHITTHRGERVLHADLLVGADGSQSTTRKLQGLPVKQHHSGDQAWITTLTLRGSHQNIAHERFTSEGALALLPLFTKNQVRLVWTLPQSKWHEIKQWDTLTTENYINRSFSAYFGNLRLSQHSQTFPLEISIAEQVISPGFVLLGNAAHTIYPLAAQGFNLGLADAAALCEILVEARNSKQSLGSLATLSRYQDWRTPMQQWVSRTTWMMSLLFGLRLFVIGPCRSLGLLFTDLCPPLKQSLGKRFLGLSGRSSSSILTCK